MSAAFQQLFDKIHGPHPESDVKIVCSDDVSFYCHKLILSQQQRFQAHPHFREGLTAHSTISLPDFDSQLIRELLRFVYLGTIEVTERSVMEYWSLLDYFLLDSADIAQVFRPCLQEMGKASLVELVKEVAARFGGSATRAEKGGALCLISLAIEVGRISTEDLLLRGQWQDEREPCIRTLVPLFSQRDSKGAFQALDTWFRKDPPNRLKGFGETLAEMTIVPEVFSQLFDHHYFRYMGWRFAKTEDGPQHSPSTAGAPGHAWMSLRRSRPPTAGPDAQSSSSTASSSLAAAAAAPEEEEASAADDRDSSTALVEEAFYLSCPATFLRSPMIVGDQEEVLLHFRLPSIPVVLGYVGSGADRVSNPPSSPEGWLALFGEQCGVNGWLLSAPDRDHRVQLTTGGSLQTETIFLQQNNDVVLSTTRDRNEDHSFTYHFQLMINGVRRGAEETGQPNGQSLMTYTAGRSVPVHIIFVSSGTDSEGNENPIPLSAHPVLRPTTI